MGSSSSGKKHKKEKRHYLDEDESGEESVRYSRHRHKEHKEKSRRHRHGDDRYERDTRIEVINLQESDSDSSDCVEVPVDNALGEKLSSDREISAPPPPQLAKYLEYEREKEKERERRQREYEREKEKDRERERDREQREYDRNRERERVREKERERYEREREMERRRERELERERVDRERERDRDRDRSDRERSDRERFERDNNGRERFERMERERQYRERERREEREHPITRDRSYSPIPENGAGDSLSIEETNKLRAKLGLKPLEIDSGPSVSATTTVDASQSDSKRDANLKNLSSYKDEWGEFVHKPADNISDQKETEKIREKLKQRKDKRFLEERLARIRTLGESDDEIDDTSKWVQRNKRVVDEKKEAAKRAKLIEEMDEEFGVDNLMENEKRKQLRDSYTGTHLKGLRVEHDMEAFTEGKTVILTLKDKDVLDEKEGDTLINVNLRDDERYKQNVSNKKKNPLSYGYNVYEEQYDHFGNPIERNILEKYDEDVDGNPINKKNFVIGENLEEQKEQQRKLLEIKTKLAGKRLETLADLNIELASDTITEAELAKFKKPKKKVKKLRQKLKADDLVPLNNEPLEKHYGSRRHHRNHDNLNEDIEMATVSSKSKNGIKEEIKTEINDEEDNNELERILTKARRFKHKENIIKKDLQIDIENIKREIKIEKAVEDGGDDGDVDGNSQNNIMRDNIILNATAEFCRTLGDIPTYGMSGNRNDDANDMMDFENDETDKHLVGHNDDDDDDADMSGRNGKHGTWNSVNPEEGMRPVDFDKLNDGDIEDVAILDEEPDVGAGVANALRLALSKGYLEKEEKNRPSNSKMSHLQAKNYSIEDKATGEEEKVGRRERFYTGPLTEFKDKEGFKPNVKLEYIDDSGRVLNLKEAFRYLSHKFHGKGPGKNKIEKRLKKMEQDGLMKTMSSTDTPLGTLSMLQQKQKETKAAYVVLSGGGKNSINAPTSLSKYK